MRDARSIHRWLLLIATAAAFGGVSNARALDTARRTGTGAGPVEHITAAAVIPSSVGLPPTTIGLEITIERWSTDVERDRLVEALKSRRANTLLDALRGLPAVGHIATATSAGWSLRFAQTRSLDDGGRQVLVASDRPSTSDGTSRSRGDTDYPVSLADIRFEKDGTGTGTLAHAANLTYEKKTGTITIDNYGGGPVRLTNVRSTPAR
jgi:hypothetical protein